MIIDKIDNQEIKIQNIYFIFYFKDFRVLFYMKQNIYKMLICIQNLINNFKIFILINDRVFQWIIVIAIVLQFLKNDLNNMEKYLLLVIVLAFKYNIVFL